MAIATALATLSACSQNPQFKINSANQAYKSGNELHTLLAKADLDAFESPSSYAANVDSYAFVIAGFEVGRHAAAVSTGGLSASAAAALDTLDRNIEGCIALVMRMAELHRMSGIDASSDITQAVRASCDQALRSVASNETSAWLVTTVADDL